MAKSVELVPGTLDLLILRTLDAGPLHGVGVSDRIRESSDGVFVVKPGSLFPALHRLERKEWIVGEWGETESGHRARFYELTRSGRAQLVDARRNFRRVFGALQRVVEGEG
jgi:PadR family transcriptional regulator PadR